MYPIYFRRFHTNSLFSKNNLESDIEQIIEILLLIN